MSRTVGPYTDVATARVEGAYELCEGFDEQGRPVEILTLGSTSSKDPARRALLSDSVAWAYATTGPEDAPIIIADLEAEQPYVVLLRDTQRRGAERIMDRLLASGPATGPLPTGPHVHRPAAPSSPAGPPMSGPPMSPPIAIPPPRRRGQAKPILLAIGCVVGMIALVVGGWLIWLTLASESSDNSAGNAAADADRPADGAAEEAPRGPAEAPDDALPVWRDAWLDKTLADGRFGPEDDTRVVALAGWPLAFLVPSDYECAPDGRSVACSASDGTATVWVAWGTCHPGCDDRARAELEESLPLQPLEPYEGGVMYSARSPYGAWKASLVVYADRDGEVLDVSAHAAVSEERRAEAQAILNDVLNQTQLLEE